jgi:hypothetical protein
MDHAAIGTKGSVPEKQRLVDKFVKSVFEDNGLTPSSSAHSDGPGEIRTPVDGFYLVTLPE